MNILIVGNGFDLSHYLPTKYDHFMVAMGAIENGDVLKGEMGFDDLFDSLYGKEDYFFRHTKAIYKTDEIKISVDQIKELQEKLKENVWYQYFSDHVRAVKTWIDFEVKIESALNTVSKFLTQVIASFEEFGDCNFPIYLIQKGDQKKVTEKYYLSLLESNHLITLRLLIKNCNYGQHVDFWTDEKFAALDSRWFIAQEKPEYGLSKDTYLNFLVNQLDNFICIFNLYLELIISKLTQNCSLSINFEDGLIPNRIYSFNYTNTYQRLHNPVDVEYLHGSCGEYQNIVLGVSDLEDESLKKIKAYGFTKYHQKLFKDTDYLFLDKFKKIIENGKKKFDEDLRLMNANALN
ncbi:MAG: AbiH family protein [Acinetobacter sp.]